MVTGDPALEGMDPDGSEPRSPQEAKAIEGRSLRQIAVGRLKRDKGTLAAMTLAGLFLLVAISAPVLDRMGVIDPFANHRELLDGSGDPQVGPSMSHLLGVVPGSGTDLLSRLMLGVTFSVAVGVCATIVAILIGLLVGLVAGFSGGKLDFLMSRFIDLVLCFPQTLMLLALSGTLIARLEDIGVPKGNVATGVYVVLVLGLFGWPTFARIIRGQVLTLRNREFIEAARSLGATNRRLYLTELLPNLWAPILIYSTLLFPVFVSAEAALGFLGVGIKAPTPTLGNIINDSVAYSQTNALYFFAPTLTVALLVLCFNLVGDGLRDALDPKADRH